MDAPLLKFLITQVKTLVFEYLVAFLNSYEPQIWTQPYIFLPIYIVFFLYHLLWKKFGFLFSIWEEQTKAYGKNQEISINVEINGFNEGSWF
jgi:hypothetical protein